MSRHLYLKDQLLPEENDYCVILYEDSPNKGNWTALLKYNGLYEHFDSYGVKPDTELKWVSATRNRMHNQNEPYLTQLLESEKEKYVYNNVTYQSKGFRVNTNTCGSHVVHRLYRLKSDDVTLPDYHQYTKSTKDQTNASYDLIVAEFVNKRL